MELKLTFEQAKQLIQTLLPMYEHTSIKPTDINYVGSDPNIKGGIHAGAIGVVRFFDGQQITIWPEQIRYYKQADRPESVCNQFVVHNLLRGWGVPVV